MSADTTDTDKGLKQILAEMQALGSKSINVGIQDDAGEHDEGGLSVAAVAYINEYGTRDGRIPARPAHTNAFDNNRRQLDALVLRLNRGVADGKLSADKAAALLGQTHEDNVKQSIRTLSSPANAPATVAAKGSSNPLIDTGQTVNSVRYVVEG